MRGCAHAHDTEELVFGTLDPERAFRVKQHIADCLHCRRELLHLQRERELFAQRAAVWPTPPVAIGQIVERSHAGLSVLRRFWHREVQRAGVVAGALAAAAALLLALRFPGRHFMADAESNPSAASPAVAIDTEVPECTCPAAAGCQTPAVSTQHTALRSWVEPQSCVSQTTLASRQAGYCPQPTTFASFASSWLDDLSRDSCVPEIERTP